MQAGMHREMQAETRPDVRCWKHPERQPEMGPEMREGMRPDMSTRHLEMLVWGPGRRKSKKTFSGQPKLPLGRLLRLASPTSVNPAGKIRQDRREKPNMNFLTSVVLGFHTTKTVLKRESDGSQQKSRPADV